MKFKSLTFSSIAAAVALASPTSYAQTDLSEVLKGFSASGFIDMSFVNTDVDDADSTEKEFNVDQVEVDFFFKGKDGISAQVDIEFGENGTGNGEDETFVEQVFITKQFNESFSLTAGRFLSYTGWETEEPTGLYQFSGTGYAPVFYGFYQQGVSGQYKVNNAVSFTLSVVNDLFSDPIESDTTNLGSEFGIHLSPLPGVTAKAFYLSETDRDAVNVWASYEVSGFTFAAEYNTAEGTTGLDEESDGYLLMANYASGDYGITFRYHAYETEDAGGTTITDLSGITIAPSLTVGDNLLLVAEYRLDTDDISDVDTNTFALEALFTF